jgi:hypothetical protein
MKTTTRALAAFTLMLLVATIGCTNEETPQTCRDFSKPPLATQEFSEENPSWCNPFDRGKDFDALCQSRGFNESSSAGCTVDSSDFRDDGIYRCVTFATKPC